MTEKERKKLNSKGIFTISQISYTFRPRRRPKRKRSQREKHHNLLKALAIKKKKIHIVGKPEFKVDGTPVYLDVEGLPDREFYYLIGVIANINGATVQRSFWANNKGEEDQIWHEFLSMLTEFENPTLIHYGSFETTFFKRMSKRHGEPLEGSIAAKAIKSAMNLNAYIYAQIYFSTYSKSLKDIGAWFGFKWSTNISSDAQSTIWRTNWEHSNDASLKESLICYNLDDCQALETLAATLLRICSTEQNSKEEAGTNPEIAHAPHSNSRNALWRPFSSPIDDFKAVNEAARWDYQRDRIYVRTDKRVKDATSTKASRTKRPGHINKYVDRQYIEICSVCGMKPDKISRKKRRILYDIRFTKFGLRRWVVEFHFRYYWCANCSRRFGIPKDFWQDSIYGRNLVALIAYEVVELCIPQTTVNEQLDRLFGLKLATSMVYDLKSSAANYFKETRQSILAYTAYESLDCAQQKCLLHLMRDLNEAILDHPFDEELKQLATGFAELLKGIVETIDRWGLKRRFLHKHVVFVDRFYRQLSKDDYHTSATEKWKTRLEKNRDTLFTFLAYDGIPWNNNNAEHAIKAFARLRQIIGGISSPRGVDDYLVLLSICQTCKYSGLDFLDFLRSREKTIEAFVDLKNKNKGGN